MANIEKHPRSTANGVNRADSSGFAACAGASRVLDAYLPEAEDRGQPVILRLEDLPATPRNLERIQERVRHLNRLLAASGTPFRLRVI